jgi:hypothetical protein
MMKLIFIPALKPIFSSLSGTRLALLMGVAPEAIVKLVIRVQASSDTMSMWLGTDSFSLCSDMCLYHFGQAPNRLGTKKGVNRCSTPYPIQSLTD